MSAPKITLHYSKAACSLAVHILLHDLNLPFTTVHTTLPPKYGTLNPKMRIPVLILDDEVITETPTIFTAIAALAPELQLLGKTHMETIRAHEWMDWLAGTLHSQGFGAFFRPERFSSEASAHAGIQAKGRLCITECFDIIEGKLEGFHALGGAYTVVDVYLFVFYRWGNTFGWTMREAYPKFTALVEELVKRPAVENSLAAEGIKSTL